MSKRVRVSGIWYKRVILFQIPYESPDGAEWIPEVDSDGNIFYIAEFGDTAETFASQFGLDIETAQNIIGKSDSQIEPMTLVSGKSVMDYTGSQILKLDMSSSMANDQRKFNQLLFTVDVTRSVGGKYFQPEDYYSNITNIKNGGLFNEGVIPQVWTNVYFSYKGKLGIGYSVVASFYGNPKIEAHAGNTMRSTPDKYGGYSSHAFLRQYGEKKGKGLKRTLVKIQTKSYQVGGLQDRFNEVR